MPRVNQIPPITDEMGRYWEQPDLTGVLIDDTHALLTLKQFDELGEYSCSQPSGVYEGKAWKRHDGIYDQEFMRSGGVPRWFLCWYGASHDPSKCSVNFREVLIA